MTPEEKNLMKKAYQERNRHVLRMMEKAQDIAGKMVAEKQSKADVILLGELLIDVGKRFD